ncbi:MAG: hypothetical protein ACTSVB_04055 [Candidatus Heimdallarchaeaceae archaeon]
MSVTPKDLKNYGVSPATPITPQLYEKVKNWKIRKEAQKWLKMLIEKRKEIDENNRYEVGWNEGRQFLLKEFFDIEEELDESESR